MPKIELCTWRFCPFAQRARIALDVKVTPHIRTEVDITRPRPKRFLAINPEGKAPTLVHDGRPLFESKIVL